MQFTACDGAKSLATITTDAFVNACDIFVFTENLAAFSEKTQQKQTVKNIKQQLNQAKKETTETDKKQPEITIELPKNKITNQLIDLKLLMNAFEMVVDDNGLAYMGEIGVALRKIDPSFDSRTYGFASITTLFKQLSNLFEFVYQDNGTSLYLKLKNTNKT